MDDSKKKFTDKQLRIIQILAGILSAAVLITVLLFTNEWEKTGSILAYLYIGLFIVFVFGRSWAERKFRIRLNLYNLALIVGILYGMLFYVGASLFTSSAVSMELWLKILIITAAFIAISVLGIALPVRGYIKRKANGTLKPLRMQDANKPDVAKPSENVINDFESLTTSQKIAAMMKELDNNKDNKDEQDK